MEKKSSLPGANLEQKGGGSNIFFLGLWCLNNQLRKQYPKRHSWGEVTKLWSPSPSSCFHGRIFSGANWGGGKGPEVEPLSPSSSAPSGICPTLAIEEKAS